MATSNGTAANQTLFLLTIAGIDFFPTVLEFYSIEHSLCAHYQFIIKVTTLTKKEIDQCLGKRATLSLKQQAFIHGLITKANSESLCLASPLSPLMLAAHNKVYRNLTLPELIDTMLIQPDINYTYERRLSSHFDYPINEAYTQYNESDFNFLQRHLFRFGFIYYFEQSKQQAKLIVTDEMPRQTKQHSLLLVAQTGMFAEDEVAFEMQSNLAVETNHVCINNYDENNPANNLYLRSQNLSKHPGHGVHYYYGEHYTTLAEGQRLLTIRQQYLDSLRFRITVNTTKYNLQPGDMLQIIGAEPFTFAGDGCFRILSIEHKGDQQAGWDMKPHHLSYFNRLTLIEAQQPYRPLYQPSDTANYQVATIETVQGNLPYLDELGRYRIRYPFDNDTVKGCGSQAIRLLQPHSGSNGGHHWPLHDGTQVVLGYVNGDIDRPVIIGTLPHENMPGPVNRNNATQHVLRTLAGHSLIMEDHPEHAHISLSTAEHQILNLDESPNQQHITLSAEHGNLSCEAGQSICITSDKQQHSVGNDYLIQSVEQTSIITQAGNITLQCQRDYASEAGEGIELATEQDEIRLQSNSDFQWQAQQDITYKTPAGHFFVTANKGQLKLMAQGKISLTNHAKATITIIQGQGKIVLSETGAVHMKAPRIDIIGQVNLQAPETIFV
jgi:type VI secretion system secreted protein VgrG